MHVVIIVCLLLALVFLLWLALKPTQAASDVPKPRQDKAGAAWSNPSGADAGVDVITDLASGEGFGLNKPMADIVGYDQGAVFMGYASQTPVLPADGKAGNQGFFLVQGNFSGDNTSGSFSVDSGGADTLVVYDGDPTQGVTQTALVLQHVTLGELNYNPGSNWVSHL